MKNMIINMTPHTINILDEDNEIATIPASGKLIRLKSRTERIREVNGIPLSRTIFGDPEGLPEIEYEGQCCGIDAHNCPGVSPHYRGEEHAEQCPLCGGQTEKFPLRYYIVSQLVKSALPNRDDLLVPAELMRDESGRIIGCRSLGG